MELLLFTLFVVKHFICDFPIQIQTPWMFQNKGTYGHWGGIAHAAIQSIASMLILLAVTVGYSYPTNGAILREIIVLGMLEWVIHYHMDWVKMRVNGTFNYKPDTHSEFWWWLGFDQLVHYLSYVAMIAITINWIWK